MRDEAVERVLKFERTSGRVERTQIRKQLNVNVADTAENFFRVLGICANLPVEKFEGGLVQIVVAFFVNLRVLSAFRSATVGERFFRFGFGDVFSGTVGRRNVGCG